ncbi:MAG TPA: ceramidase domain-containing protein, partial [Isosphaeraceae bacterium]|nr:ceramidase domain-containing protein [Isosphaeraceae bacterium]
MIDLYCERCGPGLLAEPLNALSNLAFFLAALAAWSLGKRLHALEPGIKLLIGLAVCVGMGSTLFHTFATPWAQVLDIVPILLFQIVFLRLYLVRNVSIKSTVATDLVMG